MCFYKNFFLYCLFLAEYISTILGLVRVGTAYVDDFLDFGNLVDVTECPYELSSLAANAERD